MKYKIIGIFVILFMLVVIIPKTTKAYTLNDLMSQLTSLQQQVTGLKSEMSANALLATGSWNVLGTTNFSNGEADDVSMAIGPDGTPYVAYSDDANSGGITVMKYTGSAWTVVGTADFSDGQVSSTSIAISSTGTPYVAYDINGACRATQNPLEACGLEVAEFTGGSWIPVGSSDLSQLGQQASNVSLALDSTGTPYVAYQDMKSNGQASVIEFDGQNWDTVGNPDFSTGSADSISLAIDSTGTPYVAYSDMGNSGLTTVMKYQSSGGAKHSGSWTQVGSTVSTGQSIWVSLAISSTGTPYVAYEASSCSGMGMCASPTRNLYVSELDGSNWNPLGTTNITNPSFLSLALDSSGTPYLAYSGGQKGGPANVIKFDGTNWDTVGMANFSAGDAYYDNLAIDSSGNLYIAYSDDANSDGATVMEYANAVSHAVVVAGGGGGATSGGMSSTHTIAFQPQTVLETSTGPSNHTIAPPQTVLETSTGPSTHISAVPTRTISFGMHSNEILAFQIALQRAGYFPANIKPNGQYGPATEASMIKFQTYSSLDPTGSVDGPTDLALLSLISSQKAPKKPQNNTPVGMIIVSNNGSNCDVWNNSNYLGNGSTVYDQSGVFMGCLLGGVVYHSQ
jgi:hypothetical protein